MSLGIPVSRCDRTFRRRSLRFRCVQRRDDIPCDDIVPYTEGGRFLSGAQEILLTRGRLRPLGIR